MDALRVYEIVENHPELEGMGIDTEKGEMIVKHTVTGLKTGLPLEAISEIADTDEGVLIDVLTGKREPEVLIHLTRVVGYYSRTANWNQSKLGELKDRQTGNYALK